ncbi:MAG: MBL fold metallo-hydrolase, partial [Pseudomonadota bacterium]|nr:MBL fold metallo-hydrolase [Pseudomonadota bacterium]
MTRIPPKDWYRQRGVGDGITWIDEPHIQEFYRCNIWHVQGRDRDLMIDSGMGVVSLREWVPLVSERPLDAVASHTHFDHIGCHHEFPCRLCHTDEADILADPTRRATLAD